MKLNERQKEHVQKKNTIDLVEQKQYYISETEHENVMLCKSWFSLALKIPSDNDLLSESLLFNFKSAQILVVMWWDYLKDEQNVISWLSRKKTKRVGESDDSLHTYGQGL